MKQIIIYNSKTGFAEKYANWLKEDLNIESISYKEIKKIKLSEYERIIFVTSLFANKLRNLDNLKKKTTHMVALAVGFTEMSKEYEELLKQQNNYVGPLFYVRGGINYEKLGFLARKMLKMVTKEPASIDKSDRAYLKEIEDFLKEQ